jgi:2-polyprenyl-6-methoxyphenol hydroxylase-like FAD-dependent oxidoreductase
MMSGLIGRQAVVIGAGTAGLPAAQALADHFEHVTVLERDALPAEVDHRAGTPQSRHAHALLGGGQRALGDLFPGIERDLVRAGAVPLRAGLDIRIEMPDYDPFPQRDLGWILYSMSRPLIEFTIRRRVEQHAKVTFRRHCRARSIVATADGTAVTAIHFENGDGGSETLPADLVVDASGRGNPTLDLLHAIGRAPPEETVIGVDIGYATGMFAVPDDISLDWKGVVMFPQVPQNSRGGLVLPLEGHCWIVSLGGRHADKPPGDREGFLAYVRGLRTPTIYDAIRHAQPLGEVARFGFPASVWRHFERLDAFPRGLLPIGDAFCRFNPVYGQGMSVAAQQGLLLRRLLREQARESDPLAGLASAFLAGAGALIETPWALSALPDLAFPDTEGRRPPDFERALGSEAALTRLAAQDPAVHTLMHEVLHLMKPRSALRTPDLMERVQAAGGELKNDLN